MGGQGGGAPAAQTTPGGGPSFQKSWLWAGGGGVVPGPMGAPRKAIVHGGELIIPPGGLYSLLGQLGRGRTMDTTKMVY